ncbi:MAG: DUF1801 domain-containing protein, partial [Anaerolineae bacterium]|nr:DUF1801 domain-containing protein [Anaerolineae bacterium]
YLNAAPPDVRPILEAIRDIVRRAVPDAKETISYQMPAFKLDHVFMFFAAFKRHIGVYPPVHGDDALERDLQPFRGEKGNLKFPLDQPMPYDLIRRVALALAEQAST